MEAWQKRSIERKTLLNELEQKLTRCGELTGMPALVLTSLLLKAIREEINGMIEVTDREVIETINRINGFQRTRAEGFSLKYRLIRRLLTSGFRLYLMDLQAQEVHDQEVIFDGHRSIDEVD